MMTLSNAIGGTLRTLRQEKGMTLRDVSRFVSYGHVSEIERGVKNASPEILEQLTSNLHVTLPEFLREVANYMEEY
jgi:transcriptional regulator with XRE-family HTH domain